jgi:putative toxin-antitoxin system toxin component, PIN family
MAIKIVLNTNILVSSFIHDDGKPKKIVDFVFDGKFLLCYNEVILDEYKDVLSRKRFNFTRSEIGTVINMIRQIGIIIDPVPSTIDMPDEYDRIFRDTAGTAKAWLITGNLKHFPEEDFIITANEFCELFRL